DREFGFVFSVSPRDFATFYGSGNVAQDPFACGGCSVVVLFNDDDLSSGGQEGVGNAGAHAPAAEHTNGGWKRVCHGAPQAVGNGLDAFDKHCGTLANTNTHGGQTARFLFSFKS